MIPVVIEYFDLNDILFEIFLKMTEGVSLKKFYLAQIQKREAEINEKIQNIKRLEAQRFELNSNGITLVIKFPGSNNNCTPFKKTILMSERWSKSWGRTEFSAR